MTRLYSLLLIVVLIVSFSASCKRADETNIEKKQDKSTEAKDSNTDKQSEKKKTKDKKKADSSSIKKSTRGLIKNGNLPSFADLVEVLKPSVVNISTTSVIKQRGFFQQSPILSCSEFPSLTTAKS